MNSHSVKIAKRLLLTLGLCLVFIFLLKGILGLTLAQSTEVRELEDTIPQHLPIRIKIKKEKESNFKDLKNKQWLRDMLIEVKNTGDKPIYLLHLIVEMPDIITGGNMYGFSLQYGRSDLVLFSAPLKPEDIPIKPGETYVFTIPEQKARGWERYSREENTGEPRKVRLVFQRLNFGDGTGFADSSGTPRPQPRKKRDALGRCVPESNKDPTNISAASKSRVALNESLGPKWFKSLPAGFLLANFFSIDSPKPVSAKPGVEPTDLCCPGTSCIFIKPAQTRCYCSDPNPEIFDIPTFQTLNNCEDPEGECMIVGYRTE